MRIRSQRIISFVPFLVELLLYAIFALVYFFLVLRFLGDWLREVFVANKIFYAILALTLIMAQGMLLDMLTSVLLRMIPFKKR